MTQPLHGPLATGSNHRPARRPGGGRVEFRNWILPALFLAVVFATTAVRANGWEHAAIPFEALVKALDFPEAATRARAADSLGLRGQKEALEPLLVRLRAPEPDPAVRSAIYIALGRLGGEYALSPLIACIDREDRPELRGDCVQALGRLKLPQALTRLLAILKDDPSILVRSRAVDALGNYSHAQSVTALAKLLTGRNRSLAARAIRALGETANAAAATPLLRALDEARTDSDRLAVVRALARLGVAQAVAPLTALLETTSDPQLRTAITIGIGASKDGDAATTLVRLLGDKVPAVRLMAINGLRALGRFETAGPLAALALTISRDLATRMALDNGSDATAVVAQVTLQTEALRAVTELDGKAGLEAFLVSALPIVVDTDSAAGLAIANAFYHARRQALYGLGYTDAPAAATLLAGPAGLGDPDFRLRAVAVRSLGVLGRKDAAQQVRPFLRDSAAEVRWTAATVLGRLGDGGSVPSLIDRLSDGTTEVRRQAALALGYIGDHRARAGLERLAGGDANAVVREAAAYALTLLRP